MMVQKKKNLGVETTVLQGLSQPKASRSKCIRVRSRLLNEDPLGGGC